MSTTATTLTSHTRRHLGRLLAAFYDSLPPAELGPQLAALVQRLDGHHGATATKPAG